ncbi:uncharacterized protein LOC119069741 [Bradysia coprophila]|uniref:uncharacterized protein LOC119069741 n=1 Tax=Bradysia coprophila TaxID=38358 RepID=UPI00187D7995|nr:uncharacterized protein LOC119069741 [Bradysia coprophila]
MADGKGNFSNSLQCHVCFDDYKIDQRIWQCRSGHSICELCRNHLRECPFCKAPYEGTRNYAIEDIIRELKGDGDRAGSDRVSPIAPSAPADDNVIAADSHQQIQPPPSVENDHTDSSSSVDSGEFGDMVVVDYPRPTRRNDINPWIQYSSNQFVPNAIIGGRDHGHIPLYIGRALHGRALIPGKINFEYKTCYIPWGGDEHEKSNFEILTNISGTWLPNSGGTIPVDAFAAGHSEDGETLYIGRAHIEGTLAIGKVHPSHGCCFISYAGREYDRQDYEIFVLCN